jgi:DNA repair ATPase RecN
VAEELERSPLWIFPGFEVDIGYHVLCLFPPVPSGKAEHRLNEVCDVLTQLGLTRGERFSNGEPADLRSDGAYVPLKKLLSLVQKDYEGLVIAAHAFARSGLCHADGTYAGDFQNEDLLCLEVPSFPLGPRERSVLEATEGKWKRSRPIAYIMSSDAKSTLRDEAGNPRPNSLGCRSTWIKMSEPSIEALRQAFLDWRSRIRLGEEDPRIVRHDRIVSLSVENVAFLKNQEVVFSPHLNCIIGGRGSGKSSLFESIRFAVRREADPAAQEQVKRIQDTFSQDSRLRLRWAEQDDAQGTRGLEDAFEYQPSGWAQVVSRDVADASTVFQGLEIQILSQRQVTKVASSQDYLLTFIDDLVGRRLKPLGQEETELRERIRQLQGQRRTLERLRAEERALEQEVQELERRWSARAAVQEEQKRRRAAQDAARYLENLESKAARVAGDLEGRASEWVDSHAPLGSVVKDWPESTFFQSLDAEADQALQRLAGDLEEAATRYRDRIRSLTSLSSEWERVQESLQRAEQDFRDACARLGLRPEDLDQLFQLDSQRKSKSLELETKRSQAAGIERSVQDLPGLWQRLLEVWREQTTLRREEIDRILDSKAIPRVSRTSGFGPTLEVRLDYQGDWKGLLSEWTDLSPKGSTRLGRQWEDLAAAAFKAFTESPDNFGSPWRVVEKWLEDGTGFSLPSDLLPLLRDHLASKAEAWETLRLTRVRDAVDLILYRADGSLAGSLKKRELSEGQTNTAVLMLLLASGRGPILIDQPEDELDSNFISQQLVPLLREIKNERQVILVTHNPNLPVNGDAELVYALKAEASGGKAHGVVLAQGGWTARR